VVKTNGSTLHTVYNVQQSATQGSNDTTHRLSRITAATTRFSTEGIGCQKQTAPRFCQHPIRWAFTSQAFTRWRLLSTHPINRPAKYSAFVYLCFCCVCVVDTLLILRTLYSFCFFFCLILLSHGNFTGTHSSLETSAIDLKLCTTDRTVSIRATAFLFGNLT